MRNTGLEETQAGIKTAGRNINNLRYADDTTLMAESEEELKSLLVKVKVEREEVGLKLNIQKMKIMASGPITSAVLIGVLLYFMHKQFEVFLQRKREDKDDGICSHHFMANRWGNNGNSEKLYFWGAPKSLQMVTAAMKLKDTCFLEEKL